MTCAVAHLNYSGGKWLHDGKIILPDDEKHFIKTNGKVQELTIKNVLPNDTGSYSYTTGSDAVTVSKLQVFPISIVESLQDVVGAETASAELQVLLSHEGVKGSWYKNNCLLQVSSKFAF